MPINEFLAEYANTPERSRLAQYMTHKANERPVSGLDRWTRTPVEWLADMVLGGDTRVAKEAAFVNSLTDDQREMLGKPQVYDPAIEPAFMGMDTAASFAIPRLAKMYGQYALRNSPRIAEIGNRAMTGGQIGFKPTLDMAAKIKPLRGEPVRAINEIRATKPKNKVSVYHSTNADFSEFDPSKGHGGQMWFTSRKDLAEKGYDGAQKGRIVKAELDIRNPAGWDEYEKYGIDELMSQGYDGIKLTENGEDVWVAFFPEQVSIKYNKPVK